jgi:hypothetical protein
MSDSSRSQARPTRWRLGLLAGCALALVALAPQLYLWSARGTQWQGSSVAFDFDEVAYASYLNALIAGRPRRNDPYTGRDDAPNATQPESLFSIQFVPAYALALPARALGLSAADMFISLRPLAALAAALTLFWLLALVTGDSYAAAVGAVVVLCLGGLVGEPHNAWRVLTMRALTETQPFLRRYVPALPFPCFFVFAALVWQALVCRTSRARLTYAALAGATFALLIFSYFFLWTAAAAWFVILALLWFMARRADWRRVWPVFALTSACVLLAFVPYAVLLAHRAPTMDAAQLLTHARALNMSTALLLGLAAILALATAARRGWLSWREPAVLLAASCALLPAVVFNQQLITGLSLQPVHYGRYIANYAALLALFLTALLIWRSRRPLSARTLACVALVAFSWSMCETLVRTHRQAADISDRDEARRVALRLAALAHAAPAGPAAPVVLCSDQALADALPNVAPQPVLWAQHLFVFSGTTNAEHRERLYQQLYYTGVDAQTFAALAADNSYLRLALFGWERVDGQGHTPPITPAEVQAEAQRYAAYCAAFGRAQAAAPTLAYVVVPAQGAPSLANLERWYARAAGERTGRFMLYRVTLRQ